MSAVNIHVHGCLHTVVGGSQTLKELLNVLSGPKARSAVCGDCLVLGLLLSLYIHTFNVP